MHRKSGKLLKVVSLVLAVALSSFSGQPVQTVAAEQQASMYVEDGDIMVSAADEDEEIPPQLDYILGRPMTPEEEAEQREIAERNLKNTGWVEPEDFGIDISLSGSSQNVWGALPSSYDSRDVAGKSYIPTAVRDQNPYGTCWAFASVACMEANLIKKGLADTSIDLSEAHLVYYSNFSANDPLGNHGTDSGYYNGDYLNAGGNTTMTGNALMNWKGAVNETVVPYSNKYSIDPKENDKYLQEFLQELESSLGGDNIALAYNSNSAHLKGWYQIPISDTTAVKTAIRDYGAVATSYCHEENHLNHSTAAYYCNVTKTINHAVTIIGWDDSYSKDNFNTKPASDGAWLVRNSWGDYWGKEGYFWISYQDKSLYQYVTIFDVELSDNYDNNYQYDHATALRYRGMVEKAASIFQAKANPGMQEELKAVSILLGDSNVNYSIQVYKNPTDFSNPASGVPCFATPVTGSTTYAGYWTITLPQPVELNQGDYFSVVFDIAKEGSRSASVGYELDSESESRISSPSAAKNQSFYYDSYNGWRDFGASYNANLKIKAFTTNLNEPVEIKVTGISLNKTTLAVNVGTVEKLTATVIPSNATNKNVKWASNNSEVAAVNSSGEVTALKAGTAVITAASEDGNYSASCTVTVTLPAGGYIGNINSELYSFDLKQADNGGYYLTGEIVVVEWVDTNGDGKEESTVPRASPTMTFKSADGKEQIEVFVTATGTNTYYFDRFIEGLSPNKEYVFEIASGSSNNYSTRKSMNVSLATSPRMVKIKNLGKVGEQKISYYQASNGELRLYRRNKNYVGNINSELKKTELVTGPNGNYVSGEIVVVEWEDGISTVPFETPVMYFRSIDGEEELPVWVTPTGTNTYYFDRSLGDLDTNKEYIFTIESGDSMNVSPNRSMVVTTAAMTQKEGVLWESAKQYVKYRTDLNTGELRIYGVNK